jgi:hypothetical protein
MARRRLTCFRNRCNALPVSAGLCAEHAALSDQEERETDDALRLLHFGSVDSAYPTCPVVLAELERLRKWWQRVCNVMAYGARDSQLADEVEYAGEWCKARAKDLCRVERAAREGRALPSMLMTDYVWERFAALEAGLRSNGTPRVK